MEEKGLLLLPAKNNLADALSGRILFLRQTDCCKGVSV